MRTKKLSIRKNEFQGAIRKAAIAVSAVISPFAFAQSDDEEEGDVFTLSPFEVSADTTGYAARSSLAGSRLNTELKDLASSISVLTEEFIQDIGSTSPEDAMLYSLNVENLEEYTDVTNGNAFQGISNKNVAGRVRGVASAGRTRGFWSTDLYGDNYNLSRITVNSGANAVIYGLGGVAGIVNNSYKEALLNKDRYEIAFRADSNGSFRQTLDINKVFFGEKLGIRAIFLNDDFETHRDFSNGSQQRTFFTGTYRPNQNTKILAYYESVNYEKSTPRNLVPYDGGVVDYINHVNSGGSKYFDNGFNEDGSRKNVIPAEWQGLVQRTQTNLNTWILDADSTTNIGTTNGPTAQNFWVRTIDPSAKATVGSDRSFRYSIPRSSGLVDDPAFNIQGLLTGQQNFGDIFGVTLQQKIGDNLNIEVAYNTEHSHTSYAQNIGGNNLMVRVDPNMYLADGVTPNPYMGQMYIEGNDNTLHVAKRRLFGFRTNISYDLDLRERNKWLGDHDISVLYTDDRTDRWFGRAHLKLVPGDQVESFEYRSRPVNASTFGTMQRYYLGDPFSGKINATQSQVDFHNGGYLPDDSGTYAYGNFNSPGRLNWFSPFNESTSLMGAVHSKWLNGRVVTTYGVRDAKFRQGSLPASATRDDFVPEYANGNPWLRDMDFSKTTWEEPTYPDLVKSFGGVVYATKNIGLFYNISDTFESPTNNVFLDGSPIPSATGDSIDLGIQYYSDDGRFSARLNFYETESANATTCARCPVVRNPMTGIENRIHDDVDGSYESLAAEGLLPAGAPAFDRSTFDPTITTGLYFMVADRKGEGIELELHSKPTDNLSIRFTAAENKAFDKGLLKGYDTWLASRYDYWRQWAEWEQTAQRDAENPESPVLATEDDSVTRRFQNAAGDIVALQNADGARVDQSGGWRTNLTVRYDFTEGRFKGLNAGSHLRYRRGALIGYNTEEVANPYADWPGLSDTLLAPNLDSPIFADDIVDFDLFAGFSGKMKDGKVQYNVRLNIRNALDDQDDIAQKVDSAGTIRVYRYKTPRSFILSTGFTF